MSWPLIQGWGYPGGGVPSLCPYAAVIGSSTSLPVTFSFTHNGREDFLHVKTRQYASPPHNKQTESTNRKLDNRTGSSWHFNVFLWRPSPAKKNFFALGSCPIPQYQKPRLVPVEFPFTEQQRAQRPAVWLPASFKWFLECDEESRHNHSLTWVLLPPFRL